MLLPSTNTQFFTIETWSLHLAISLRFLIICKLFYYDFELSSSIINQCLQVLQLLNIFPSLPISLGKQRLHLA